MVLAAMENEISGSAYEDARKQRLLENKKRFEDLGIVKISKSLTDLTKSEKPKGNRQVRAKPMDSYSVEPRRSSRARTQVSTYRDEVDVEVHSPRNRSKFHSSWTSYLARPAEEVKVASYGERARAFNSAEKLRSNLQTGYPSFVKSMVRSHVYSCFWLGLPSRFCEDHLPKSTTDMVLENEEGSEYDAIYIGKRAGLSGGWRAFALDHKLDDGDALVFELIQPTRFKVYIVRAFECQNENIGEIEEPEKKNELYADEKPKKETKKRKANDSNEIENSAEVSATRRSLRNKGDGDETNEVYAEKPKKETKKRKVNDSNEIENSAEVSATRRSLRNKGDGDEMKVYAEKPKKERKKRETNDNSGIEKSAEVSATRSLKNKGDEEETNEVYDDGKPKKETKKRKSNDSNGIEKSAEVAATRRSLRNKGK